MTFSALRAGDGRGIGLIAACEDLSAIRAMEARMRAADRLATLGRMAANIAHEIRNPLAALSRSRRGHGRRGRRRRPRAPRPDRPQGDRAPQRDHPGIPRVLAAGPAQPHGRERRRGGGRSAPAARTPGRPGTLKVVREFAPAITWTVDRQQFRQAVWNLCLNAVQAMPDGGELRVTMAAAGARLVLRVNDTGEGIAARRPRPHLRAVLLEQVGRQRPRPGPGPPDRAGSRRRDRRPEPVRRRQHLHRHPPGRRCLTSGCWSSTTSRACAICSPSCSARPATTCRWPTAASRPSRP